MKNPVRVTIAFALLLTAGCGGSDRSFYPLDAGLTWEYQVLVTPAFGPPQADRATLTNLGPRELEDRKVIPQRVDSGGRSNFTFVVSDQTGIYEVARQFAGELEPEILQEANYILRQPMEPGGFWQTTARVTLSTEEVTIPTQTTVESMGIEVTVPAGTFDDCVKTRSIGTTTVGLGTLLGDADISIQEYSWYCRGAGLTKVVRKVGSDRFLVGSGKLSMELASFHEHAPAL